MIIIILMMRYDKRMSKSMFSSGTVACECYTTVDELSLLKESE